MNYDDTIKFKMIDGDIEAIVLRGWELTNDLEYDHTAIGSDGLRYDLYSELSNYAGGTRIDWWCVRAEMTEEEKEQIANIVARARKKKK